MLVLSRKEAESIRIGESIVVTVVRLGRDRVQLGIAAPPEVAIRRAELRPLEPTLAPAAVPSRSTSIAAVVAAP